MPFSFNVWNRLMHVAFFRIFHANIFRTQMGLVVQISNMTWHTVVSHSITTLVSYTARWICFYGPSFLSQPFESIFFGIWKWIEKAAVGLIVEMNCFLTKWRNEREKGKEGEKTHTTWQVLSLEHRNDLRNNGCRYLESILHFLKLIIPVFQMLDSAA